MDLGIVGGEVVTGAGRRPANVYVSDGRIAAVTAERRAAAETFDATGALVMPGMMDAHVHFMDPGDPEREDFADRSRVDFALAAHAWPDRLEEVAGVYGAGAAFIKAFTCTTHGVPG